MSKPNVIVSHSGNSGLKIIFVDCVRWGEARRDENAWLVFKDVSGSLQGVGSAPKFRDIEFLVLGLL